MKRFSIVLVVLLSVLLTVASVLAAPPVKEEEDWEETSEVVYCNEAGIDVGDFSIMADTEGTNVTTSHTDKDGNVVRFHRHQTGSDQLYHEDYPDNYIASRFTDNLTITYDSEGNETSTKYAGTPWNVHLPGHGNVYRISGPAFYDGDGNFVKAGGLYVDDFITLCEYFAP